MSTGTPDLDNIPGSPDDREFLYTVLNLPTTASEYEIRERYRQLSVLFHPDKQQEEQTKETATKRFLEVQKAYQVLSDPINRRAYDLLGPKGLQTVHNADLSEVPPAKFDAALIQKTRELLRERAEEVVRSKGRITATIDARSLFEGDDVYDDDEHWSSYHGITDRLSGIRQTSSSIRHSVETDISERTSLVLTGRASSRGSLDVDDAYNPLRTAVLGTVRHQFSPRLNFEATANLLHGSDLNFKTIYRDEENTVVCEMGFTRALFQAISSSTARMRAPPLTLAFSRRLFPHSPLEGTVSFSTSSTVPILSVSLFSGHVFDHTPEASIPPALLGTDPTFRPPSKDGLSVGTTFWNVQASLAGLMSGLGAEWGVVLSELGLRLKIVFQFGLAGLNWSFGGEWRRGDNSLGSSVALGLRGVILRLDAGFLGQQVSLPIVLSDEHNMRLALCTTVMPSTALVFTYWFVLRPRRRRERLEFFRRARRTLHEEKSDLLRESKETVHLLEDAARRHMQTEASCNGLVILEASYGPSERDEATAGLDVDVTVPLQALVHRSQLYIPGRRSKAGLQGFYDPAPGVAKTLRIRYAFCGYSHYAEIPDWMPVVLPLEEHRVD